MDVYRPDAKAGAFILGGLALFIFTIFRIGGYLDDWRGGLQYTLLFDNAQQVETGAEVYHRGIKVGRVNQISLAQDNKTITMTIRLQEETPILIDTQARILDKSMLGGKVVELVPPADPNQKQLLPAGSQIKGLPPTGLAATMDMVTDMINDYRIRIDSLFDKVDALVSNLNTVATKTAGGIDSLSGIGTKVDTTLSDYSALAKSLETEVKGVTEQLNTLLANTDTRVGAVQEDVHKLTTDLQAKVENLTTRLDKLLADSNQLVTTSTTTLDENRDNLKASLESLKHILTQLEEFSEKIANRPSSLVWSRNKKSKKP